jgi:class 3 adenylate cyclase
LLDAPPTRLPPELQGTVTLLFTDIEGSSRLIERLGDARAQDVLRDHHALLAAQAAVCGGHVVKTQGDGAMIAFPGASQALRDGDDFGGRAVVVAARIANAASGGEILVSGVLHALTATTGEFSFGSARGVEMKGLNGEQTVFPVEL